MKEEAGDARHLYLAYGRDMAPSVMHQRCPGAICLGFASLANWRLAVIDEPIEAPRSSALTLERVEEFTVCGVVYELSTEELALLDRTSGVRPLPHQAPVDVLTIGTRRVIEPIHAALPSERLGDVTSKGVAAFLLEVLDAARACQVVGHGAHCPNLSSEYEAFLQRAADAFASASSAAWAEREGGWSRPSHRDAVRTRVRPMSDDGNTWGPFLVRPTRSRARATTGLPLVVVPRSAGVTDGNLVAVNFRGNVCLALARVDSDVPSDVCELDQEARHALGFRGLSCFGDRVFLHRFERVFRWGAEQWLWNPRTLTLPVWRSHHRDASKRICVLHPNRLRYLGVEDGGWLILRAAVRTPIGEVEVREIRRRAFAWSPTLERMRSGHDTEAYPGMDHVYLDREAREELFGTDEDAVSIEHPVLIQAQVGELFATRIMYYGIGAFASLLAFAAVGEDLFAALDWHPLTGRFVGRLFALALAAWATVYDIRHRVRY